MRAEKNEKNLRMKKTIHPSLGRRVKEDKSTPKPKKAFC